MNTGWQLSGTKMRSEGDSVLLYKSLCTNVLYKSASLSPPPEQDGRPTLRGYRDNPGTQISKISTCQREPGDIEDIHKRQ